MEGDQELQLPNASESRKRLRRDGYKICNVCNEKAGLRAKQCTHCETPFPCKVKDWAAIEKRASTMKETYIKDKLFDRIDLLSTKSGWTGIVFLVHENAESKSGQKRMFQHCYSTKGAGKKIEEAMKATVFKAMKNFLYGDVKAHTEKDNSASETVEHHSEAPFANSQASTIPSSPTNSQMPSPTAISSPTDTLLSTHIAINESAVASPSCITSLPLSTISAPSSFTNSRAPSPSTTARSFSPALSNHPAPSTANQLFPATSTAQDPNRRHSPSAIDRGPSTHNSCPFSPADSNIIGHASLSSETANISVATQAPVPSTLSSFSSSPSNALNRQGKIIEVNGKKYFLMNAKFK